MRRSFTLVLALAVLLTSIYAPGARAATSEFVDLVPCRYKVFVPDDARVTGKRVALVKVAAGAVAHVRIHPFAKGAEGKRPPKDTTPTFVPQEIPDAVGELPSGER